MKTFPLLIAAGLWAALPLAASAEIERVVEKSFNVQPGGTLSVETSGGSIRVETAQTSQVNVVAKQRIRASSEAEADRLLKDLDLTIEQNGNDVRARAKLNGIKWGRQPVQVDFVVSVPTRYHADLRTSGGNVDVGDLDGRLQARTSGGNVTLGRITGDVDAGTSGGDVRLAEGKGRVKLGTSGGNIRVQRAGGHTELDTSGGNIEIESVEGSIQADTSGGNVRAGIRGPLQGDCVLGTSGGQVRVTVDKTAAFNLDASTSGGDVEAEGLTITIERGGSGKSRLAGKVNGGGPLLKLRSSGGDIDVKTR
ncbi:MAG TPA: DUF4097 family beta strand repeat-containing protein [Opitutus sp.]|nr:DUF4097 family beta strand repeat-containing protein [Opitutus sp.]